ncbi:MAG: hypothetical protein ABFE01_09960 [Phycisphaerales bacterium]
MQQSPNALAGGTRAQSPRRALSVLGMLLVLVPLALEVAGCNGFFRPVDWSNDRPEKEQDSPFRVHARKSSQVATLSPDDIVRIMQRVGFADEQIMELGTPLHNAIRFEGAAVVYYKKEALAMFVADGDYIKIRTRSGSLTYEVSKGQFVSSSPMDR